MVVCLSSNVSCFLADLIGYESNYYILISAVTLFNLVITFLLFILRVIILKKGCFFKEKPIDLFFLLYYGHREDLVSRLNDMKTIYAVQWYLYKKDFNRTLLYINNNFCSLDTLNSIFNDTLFLYYKFKIKENQLSGGSAEKERIKLNKKLNKLEYLMQRIKFGYKNLFQNLLEKKPNVRVIEKHITDIEAYEEKCDCIFYNFLSQMSSNPKVLRKYSHYLREIKMEDKLSKIISDQVDELENTNELTSTMTSIISGSVSKSLLSGNDASSETTNPILSTKSFLMRKIQTQRNLPGNLKTYTVGMFLIGLLFLFCSIFFVFSVLDITVKNDAYLHDVYILRSNHVGGSFFLRKSQISLYGEEETPFESERATSVFRNLTSNICKSLTIYERESFLQFKEIWNRKVLIYEYYHYNIENDSVVSTSKYIPLFDAITRYSLNCLDLLESPNEDFGSREAGVRLEDNDKFIYVTINEKILYGEFDQVITSTLDRMQGNSMLILNWSLYVICSVFIALVTILIFVSISANIMVRRTIKGLFLLPREAVSKLAILFRDGRDNFPIHISLSQFTIYFLLSLIFITFIMINFLPFYFIGYFTYFNSINHNVKSNLAGQIQINIRRIHLDILELLYRENTILPTENVLEDLNDNIERLSNCFSILRLGDIDGGIKAEDDPEIYNLFYENQCDIIDEEDELYEKLKCYSLNYGINEYLLVAKKFLSNHSKGERDSAHYQEIIHFDSPKSSVEDGLLHQIINKIERKYQQNVSQSIDFYRFLSLFIFIAEMILYIKFFTYLYSKLEILRKVISRIKRVILLFPENIIRSENIMLFITKSRYGHFSQKKKKNDIGLFNALEKNKFAVIFFDRNLNIHFLNDTAKSIFQINDIKEVRFFDIFKNGKVKNQINQWVKNVSSSQSENSHLSEVRCSPIALYSESFLASCSLSFGKNGLYLAIIQNIEHTTKKRELLEEEKRKSEDLLLNILPIKVANQVMKNNYKANKTRAISVYENCTFIFMDIVNFGTFSEKNPPEKIILLLHDLFSLIDGLCVKYGIEKIKTIGDTYFAVSGLPEERENHAIHAVMFAFDVLKEVEFFISNSLLDIDYLGIRIGLHSGECIGGIIGKTKWCYDVWGDDVNIASRMKSNGIKGKIQVSGSTFAYIKGLYDCHEREIEVKGKGKMRVFVISPSSNPKLEILRRNSVMLDYSKYSESDLKKFFEKKYVDNGSIKYDEVVSIKGKKPSKKSTKKK